VHRIQVDGVGAIVIIIVHGFLAGCGNHAEQYFGTFVCSISRSSTSSRSTSWNLQLVVMQLKDGIGFVLLLGE
jgi:hypothetical protein